MKLISQWHKWPISENENSAFNRTSGSVCGLDPEFCADSKVENWPDDITKWPVNLY